MAYPPAESPFPSDIFYLKRISDSFPNVSSLFTGFSTKAASDSDPLRSPTSILDFSFLTSLSNSFKLRSPGSSSSNGNQRKWDFGEVGLGMINALVNEDDPSSEISCLQRKDIIFGLQANRSFHCVNHGGLGCTPKSKSLPRSFRIVPQAKLSSVNPELANEDAVGGNARVQLELKSVDDFSSNSLGPRSFSMLSRTDQNQGINSSKFFTDGFTSDTSTAPVADEDISPSQPLAAGLLLPPVPILQRDGCVRSLSAEEIEHSEDYTCIISYGPNSKTTHIFGDFVLDCRSNNPPISTEDSQEVVVHGAESEGVAAPRPFIGSIRHCLLCQKNLGDEEEICEYETSLCAGECLAEEIIGEVIDKIQDCSHKDASGSCSADSLFTVGTPLAI
ncbi:hypothetical protein MLD38_007951 [Melastoma candidum]|uniref:Uncharacterized protein n=1 Tax=Melastoma candidum TaxID=119954 RepID=A0ACB9RTB0_9MYRT|nr:hypothetical protein MLD38_007951 [Melastoma candidum]